MQPRRKKRRELVVIGVLALMITTSCANQKSDGHSEKQVKQSVERTSEDKGTDSSKDFKYVQWYLDGSETFAEHTNELAWGMDLQEAKPDIDLSYKEGIEKFSGKREVKVAVIDSKLEHGERIINILNDGDMDNSYESLCMDNHIKTFLIDIDYGNLNDDEVIDAIGEAESKGASICVMAFTTTVESEKVKGIMENSNMLFVSPSGNDGVELGEFNSYPAMYGLSNVLIVGDERCDGKVSDLSNYSRDYVDIIAPGTDIACLDGKGKRYESGTSYACAIAAGVCAIVKAGSDNEFNNVELKNYICSLCTMDETIKEKVKYGRINAIGEYLQSK